MEIPARTVPGVKSSSISRIIQGNMALAPGVILVGIACGGVFAVYNKLWGIALSLALLFLLYLAVNMKSSTAEMSASPEHMVLRGGYGFTLSIPLKNGHIFILTILMAITACEWIFAFRDVALGIVLSLFLAILIYLIISVFKVDQDHINASESLTLIPLYILFTSSLPWFFLATEVRLPAVYSIIIALCAWHIYQRGIQLDDLGFKRENVLPAILLGVVLGVQAGIIEYFVINVEPMHPDFSVAYLLRDFFYMLFFVGLAEEVLFRRIIQRDLIKIFGCHGGIFLQAALFGVMHLTWRSHLELFFTFAVGLVLGYFYQRTGSLTGPVIMHGIGNTMLVAVMPYIV
ncbi:MAG: CPBP family intramembrane metalloprotease [Firmicutes bacterium]|nr:CPBP family intramembrane metalloprotease [Bacillota bacterium]